MSALLSSTSQVRCSIPCRMSAFWPSSKRLLTASSSTAGSHHLRSRRGRKVSHLSRYFTACSSRACQVFHACTISNPVASYPASKACIHHDSVILGCRWLQHRYIMNDPARLPHSACSGQMLELTATGTAGRQCTLCIWAPPLHSCHRSPLAGSRRRCCLAHPCMRAGVCT